MDAEKHDSTPALFDMDEKGTPATRPVNIRGVTDSDIAGVDRIVRRALNAAPSGARVSRNAGFLMALRMGIAASDASAADVAPGAAQTVPPSTPARSIPAEVRKALADVVAAQHPKPIVGTALDIVAMIDVAGATPVHVGHALSRMSEDAGGAVSVSNLGSQSVPNSGSYCMWALFARPGRKGSASKRRKGSASKK